MVVIKCPHCGHTFNYKQLRGQGADYAKDMTRLNHLQLQILTKLRSSGATTPEKAIPKRLLVRKFADEDNYLVSGHAVTSRLSELLGAGCVVMTKQRVEVRDRRTMQFRYRKIPVWYALPEQSIELASR